MNKRKNAKKKNSNTKIQQNGLMSTTPYDDVFRTISTKCRRLLIPIVNEVFKKSYDFSNAVIMDSNELFVTRQNGKQDKRISDSIFYIDGDAYQIECQSTSDGSMMIRVWEYGSQVAIRNATYDEDINTLRLKFPQTAVLYLRCSKKSPEYTAIHVEFPEISCEYQVPNINMSKYSIEDIFEKKLYFLIPFYLFVYERQFPYYNEDEKALKELESVFFEIFKRLNMSAPSEMSSFEKGTIRDMSEKIVHNLAKNHENIKKGIGGIMGGNVLEYEADRIKEEGREEGRKEGREEGRINDIRSMLEDGKTVRQIVEFCKFPYDEVKAVADSITKN